MATQANSTFTPRFEGRTRDAVVTGMVGNVVSIKMKRRPRNRPSLKTTAVLVCGRA